MTNEEIIERVSELEKEIRHLQYEYSRQVSPCQNKECGFYNKRVSNHCTWTHWITDCRDYISEEEDNNE